MSFRFFTTLGLLLVTCSLRAQPVIDQLQPFRPRSVNSLRNLRVVSQNASKTEAVLAMDYTYDGLWGGSVLLLPVVEKRNQKGVSAWFGADPVPLTPGQGLISVKVKYFNDEPGVPPQLETDRIKMLYLNSSGITVISSSLFLKTIDWGSPDAKPMVLRTPPPAREVISVPKPAETETSAVSLEAIRLDQQKKEEARKLAEERTRRLEQEKRQAEEKLRLEAEARAEARRKAQAEEQARLEAEAKAKALAEAREKERLQAEAEAKRLADQKRQMEEKALREAQAQELERLKAEIRAQEEARVKAEMEAKRLLEEKRLAEERAKAEAQAREEARLKMEAEERERIKAEAKAQAEAAAREKERLQAEAELKRLAEEKLRAEERLRAEEKARQLAAEAAKARTSVPSSTAKTNAVALAPKPDQTPSRIPSAPIMTEEPATNLKTKITNVDVVNRSLDRSQMTIGVEFEYRDQLGKPVLGVDVMRTGDPETKQFFSSSPAEIGRSRRNFVLVPVKFQPPRDQAQNLSPYSTDQLLVYLAEGATSRRFNLFNATMLLIWSAPGITPSAAAVVPSTGNSLEMDDFKQNDLYSGYVTVRYQLKQGPGQIRMRLFDSANPASSRFFRTQEYRVQAGRNLQLMEFSVDPEARSAPDVIKADTIEIELLDASGQVAARLSKKAAMTWAKPK